MCCEWTHKQWEKVIREQGVTAFDVVHYTNDLETDDKLATCDLGP
jgi:hypothetical protein